MEPSRVLEQEAALTRRALIHVLLSSSALLVGVQLLRGADAPAEPPASEAEKKPDSREAGAEPEKKYPPLEPGMGIIEGTVLLDGPAPEIKALVVPKNNQDHAFCVEHVVSEELIVGPKKQLKNAVVSVGGHRYRAKQKPKPRKPVMDNRNCLFVPHVMATTVGSTLVLTNSDDFVHNARGLLRPLSGINVAIPSGGRVEKKLRRPGWGVMKCDFHPWMTAHVHVFNHELFDVSARDGTWKIVNVPPGTYEIEIWHERLQPVKRKITVEAGKTTRLDVGLQARK